MSTSVSPILAMAVLVIMTSVVWAMLIMLGIKNGVLRSAMAAIISALLFQTLSRIHLGFWDPFWPIALFVSTFITVFVCVFLELLIHVIDNRWHR